MLHIRILRVDILSKDELSHKNSQQVLSKVCFNVVCSSSQVTMWRMSWERRLVPWLFMSEWSPGSLHSGSAWKKSACEAVANDSFLQASAGSKDLHTRPWSELVQPPLPPQKASLTA